MILSSSMIVRIHSRSMCAFALFTQCTWLLVWLMLIDAATPVDASGANLVPKIVGGSDPGGPIEYQALIYLREPGSQSTFQCGGSLIASNVVLTAAHCAIAGDSTIYDVYLGVYRSDTIDFDPDVEYRSVTASIIHPKYSVDVMGGVNYDFNLLLLNDHVMNMNPIAVDGGTPSTTTDLEVGDSLYVSGWGTTQFGGSGSNILLESELNYVSSSECNEAYSGFIGEQELCASAPGKDACQGDSGGPIVYRESSVASSSSDILVGVTSYGEGCATPGYPGVYARVQHVYEWIESVLCNDWSDYTIIEYCGPVTPTTPSPTVTPPLCTDYSNFVDSFGDDCTYYEENDTAGCPLWGDCDQCDAGFGTPGEACCWCGGGNEDPGSTTASPTESPTASSSPSATSTKIPTIFPTTSSRPTGACTDTPGFIDVFGDDCSYYKENDVRGCPVWGNCQQCDAGFGTPGEACCWCGGGEAGPVATTTPAPSIACEDYPNYIDFYGDSCAWYKENLSFGCESLDTCCAANDVTPGEACCWCNGGVKGDILPTTPPHSQTPTSMPTTGPTALPLTPEPTTSPIIQNPVSFPTKKPTTTVVTVTPTASPLNQNRTSEPTKTNVESTTAPAENSAANHPFTSLLDIKLASFAILCVFILIL